MDVKVGQYLVCKKDIGVSNLKVGDTVTVYKIKLRGPGLKNLEAALAWSHEGRRFTTPMLVEHLDHYFDAVKG